MGALIDLFYLDSHRWAKWNLIRVRDRLGFDTRCEIEDKEFFLELPNCKITLFSNRLTILDVIAIADFKSLGDAFACAYLMTVAGFSWLDYPVTLSELGQITRCALAIKGEEDLNWFLEELKWQPSALKDAA